MDRVLEYSFCPRYTSIGIFEHFDTGGLELNAHTCRGIWPTLSGASDIPEFVQDGIADLGITGIDLIKENEAEVIQLLDLKFGKTNLVLAAPENSNINTIGDITEDMTIATEFPTLTKKYLDKNNLSLKIVKLSGSTEAAPFIGVADLITDLTSTGTTLKMNHLEIVDTLLESSIVLVANRESVKTKKDLIDSVSTSIKGVLDASRKKLLMMNVKTEDLNCVKEVMPSMGGLTVSDVLSDDDMVAAQAVIDESEVFELVNKLRKAGAKDILVVPIERII